MHLIDITNSYPELVRHQLEGTDAQEIRVYSLGQSTVVYTQAPHHIEVLIRHDRRPILNEEIEYTLNRLVKRSANEGQQLNGPHSVEFSFSR